MRLPNAPLTAPTEAHAAAYAATIARRAPNGLNGLDLALLHAPAYSIGWSSMVSAVRTQNSLPPTIRELIFARIAALNNTVFEWEIHSGLLVAELRANGKPEAEIDAFMNAVLDVSTTCVAPSASGSTVFLELEAAVVRFADYSTLKVNVPDEVFAGLKSVAATEGWDDAKIVEVVGTVATFNCVTRFCVALEVGNQKTRSLTWPLE
ncbi:AhpD-like protein [Mycena capillaripes]|nr:AhpD-like protein [Mycena capillaripes]